MIKNIKNSILSIGSRLDGPEFIKEYLDQSQTIDGLETLKCDITDENILQQIDQDIMYIKYGDVGEKNVAFELKNSFIPMYVLHDVYLEYKDLTCQLDYVLITNKFICILETKKLNGDIEIRNNGDFVRTFKNRKGKILKKEGMYSPISQNERHVEILQRILLENKLIKRMPIYSLVVLANPKSIVNSKFAPKTLKNQIVKADQLKKRLATMIAKEKDVNVPILTMKEIADGILDLHQVKENTFVNKYKKHANDTRVDATTVHNEDVADFVGKKVFNYRSDDAIRTALKAFRLERSREDKIKAYYIFNNAQMEEIIALKPSCKNDLMSLKGFGAVKIEKYGGDILRCIIKN